MNPEVNETQPEETQDGIDLSNDELGAAMGFMTTLGEQQMTAEQEAQEAQGEEIAQEEEAVETETTVAEPVDPEAIKGEILGDLKKEMPEMLKGVLKELLDEDETSETS